MTTRFEKQMEGNLERILSEENLISLGWLPVPSIDGSNCSSWAEIVMKMRESGMDIHVDGDWPTCPIVVRNQKLFHVSPEFCAKVAESSGRVRWIINVEKGFFVPKQQLYGAIKSHDTNFTKKSCAYSFNLEGLIDMKKPEAITLTKLDGIIAYGPWFTSGHIETGGDDSITHVPIGRKLMVIAKRGNPARRLEALMTSVKSLVNLLTKPPPKRFGCDVKLFFTSPDAIMVQPALWAHTVITFGNGPSLVVGFEGLLNNDGLRREQVLKYFASGIERERQTHLLQILPDHAILRRLEIAKKKKTALYEQLDCLQHDSKSSQSTSSKRNCFVTRKNRRLLNLPRCRRRIEQKMATKNGNIITRK